MKGAGNFLTGLCVPPVRVGAWSRGLASPSLLPLLVVSIHDVSPRTRAACDELIGDLAAQGVAKTSLLIVPNHHGHGHFLEDEEFCAWLANRAREGHEIVPHGYFHRRDRRPGESARDRWVTRVYTADEGEFFDLSRDEATTLLERGKADFQRFRSTYAPALPEPRGFIAPAWLLGAAAEEAVRAAGYEYTTRLAWFEDLARGRRMRTQSLVWSPRSAARRAISLAWNAFLFRRLDRAATPVVRLGIHPPDAAFPPLRRQIGRLTSRALARGRRPATYAEALDAWRAAGQ